jgi:hypothetical protein
MTIETVYIRNPLSGAGRSRSSAHSATDRNSNAGRPPLERTDYQLAVTQKIETDPVNVGEFVK